MVGRIFLIVTGGFSSFSIDSKNPLMTRLWGLRLYLLYLPDSRSKPNFDNRLNSEENSSSGSSWFVELNLIEDGKNLIMASQPDA